MRLCRPRSAILIKLVVEDSVIVPSLQHAGHDELIELRVRLNAPQPLRHIQTLDRAAGAVPEIHATLRYLVDHVTVHLLEVLAKCQRWLKTCLRCKRSYQFVFTEYLLPSIRQGDFLDRDLPSTIATTNARAQSPSNNLVAETDPNNGFLVL